ncbi:hypothetical protein CCR75_004778 [Bremia lactucae]|uniref:Uncharacterized protein n=1 Tax=Bremia lactucae TaxID=4779 RepID=A0A976FNF5_BRELC|nr:hypothetical protein CCR75_004778 [Bremia lactucae]
MYNNDAGSPQASASTHIWIVIADSHSKDVLMDSSEAFGLHDTILAIRLEVLQNRSFHLSVFLTQNFSVSLQRRCSRLLSVTVTSLAHIL